MIDLVRFEKIVHRTYQGREAGTQASVSSKGPATGAERFDAEMTFHSLDRKEPGNADDYGVNDVGREGYDRRQEIRLFRRPPPLESQKDNQRSETHEIEDSEFADEKPEERTNQANQRYVIGPAGKCLHGKGDCPREGTVPLSCECSSIYPPDQ